MPIKSYRSVKRREIFRTEGTQYIRGVLTLPTYPDTATIYLSPDVYKYPGTFIVFDYSKSTASTPVQGDLAQVSVDGTGLVYSNTVGPLVNHEDRKVITVTLSNTSAPSNNGTQYIDGTLTINSPMTVELAADLFGAPGTYILFSYATFVGSITNITIIPPPGRFIDTSVSPNGCAISGSTITVKLV